MADDRTCLDCIAQYSHLPVKLCEEHADERRAGETRMTLKELAEAAEAAQEKAWEANNAAWAAWQAAFDVAQDARALAEGKTRVKTSMTWRQAMGDDPA